MLHKIDYGMILEGRRLKVMSSYSIKDFRIIFSGPNAITEKDMGYLATWKQYQNSPEVACIFFEYKDFLPSELIDYLAYQTKRDFPLPVSLLPSLKSSAAAVDNTLANKIIIAYYVMNQLPTIFPKRVWSAEQLQVLEAKERLVVVNAGPGTGKTTIANERVFRCRHQGVILISYTNSAIEENYRRMFEYPGISKIIGKKDYKKSLVMTTVDSLACYTNSSSKHSESFTANIRSAIESIKTNPSLVEKFGSFSLLTNESLMRYSHIVVDEAQDIDDIRAEFIFTLFAAFPFKTLFIFGDPRQRLNTGAGQWYVKLWTQGLCPLALNILPLRVGFSVSHRFKNKELLRLCNDLSLRRPVLHHSLITDKECADNNKIDILVCKNGSIDDQIVDLARHIKETLHGQCGIPYKEMVAIGPSLNKTNKASMMANKICAIFKDTNIPCYVGSDSTYQPNGLQFSTIHGVKGKEFDVVILFGISDFPNTFTMIPYEEAESLLFVMHTRARRKIYYILDWEKLPRGINTNYLTDSHFEESTSGSAAGAGALEFEDSNRLFGIHDTVNDFGFGEFLEYNKYSVTSAADFTLRTHLPRFPAGSNPRWWGVACGIGVQMALTGKYPHVFISFMTTNYVIFSPREYQKRLRRGVIIHGFDQELQKFVIQQSAINGIRQEEFEICSKIKEKDPSTLNWSEFIVLVMVCEFFIAGHMIDRYDVTNPSEPENIFSLFRDIAKELKELYGNCEGVEYKVKMGHLVGAIDSLFLNKQGDCTVIEFKTVSRELCIEDRLQTWLYNQCVLNSKIASDAVLINLISGKCEKLKSENTFERWKYILASYTQLKIHIDFTESLINRRASYPQGLPVVPVSLIPVVPENTYCVDTEFQMYDHGIFDIALINVTHPYRSIVSTVLIPQINKSQLKFASEWLDVSPTLFPSSPPLETIYSLFENVSKLYKENATLCNYVSPVDVKWAVKMAENRGIKINTCDLSDQTRVMAKYKGCFLNNSDCAKLGDFYSMEVMPLELPCHSHLEVHTAISDALMLYTLIKLGICHTNTVK